MERIQIEKCSFTICQEGNSTLYVTVQFQRVVREDKNMDYPYNQARYHKIEQILPMLNADAGG